MKILIADDEAPARRRLRALVEELDGHTVLGEAADGREALMRTHELDPDVLLLDIRMPGMDGLEAARHVAGLEHPPAVIFTTAYGDHALEAFEAHAVDYLLKPIRRQRLAAALDRARRLTRAQLGVLGVHRQEAPARTHLCARLHGALALIPVAEIRCLQAGQKYVTVRDADREVLIEESLKGLEQEFGDRFLRIHRNALVAWAYVTGLERDVLGRVCVRLRDVVLPLEVSRRHLPQVRRALRAAAPRRD
ncbi:MAG: DNA-binding response regulator [Chromatiales bacterium 21-64-14]|nr:MAG: DNA-binding response regulator [Chromatiales bacterium 21-64-14]HQU14518.1 LytTR family DNA-binding domain-containing protein [Gammaproteobacteria bacterium]